MIDESVEYNRLSQRAVKAWRINGGLLPLILWLAAIGFVILNIYEPSFPLWLVIATAGTAFVFTVLLVFVVPPIHWRQWRYKVNEHEIDLHHGIWFTRRTLIPVKRVQHVDTRQGPILRKYNLADVVISTAATTHKIPALTEDTANRVRSEISTFARKAKSDV